MTDTSRHIAERMFAEINENRHLAEQCWKSNGINFEVYFRNAKEKLQEFGNLFER